MPPEVKKKGIELLHVAVKACRIQHRMGGSFILEHPQCATSWQEPEVRRLLELPGVHLVTLDQCEYGLLSRDEHGGKRTMIATNMLMAELVLGCRCQGSHRHVQLVHNRAAGAQVYPRDLCLAFVEALRLEVQDHAQANNMDEENLYNRQKDAKTSGPALDTQIFVWCWENGKIQNKSVTNGAPKTADNMYELHEEDLHEQDLYELHEEDLHEQPPVHGRFDENTGEELDPFLLAKGRAKEYDKLVSREVYEAVPRWMADQDKEGKKIKTRWVDVVKGDVIKSRFVAQELAAGDPREDLFAGTPPLFAARLLLSLAAVRRPEAWGVMVLDVACAFLYAAAKRNLYVELPEQDPKHAGGGACREVVEGSLWHVGRSTPVGC